jgi:hypothetical protein
MFGGRQVGLSKQDLLVGQLQGTLGSAETSGVTLSINMPRRARAGRRAERRYRELRGRWRRRVLWRFRLVVWPVMALSLLGAALPSHWRWLAGFLGGASYAFWLHLRDAVPQHIERWLDGANGERWTEKELRKLERAGWVVAHDLEARWGNVDHFLVGPGGVFLLDSKNWFGEVTVEGGVATVTPRDNPDAAWSWPRLTNGLKAASAKNKEAIQRLTGVRTWVQPVVVVWAPFAQGVVASNGVVFVAGEALADWLVAQPQRLDALQTEKVARIVSA